MTAEETEVYVFVRWLDFEMKGWGERKSGQHIRSNRISTNNIIR